MKILSSQGHYLRLETHGRRTGKPHQVLVRYITADSKIIIFPQSARRQDWVANILATPKVKLYTEQGILQGNAALGRIHGLDDPLLGAFTRKYGLSEVRQRYWGQNRYVEVALQGDTALANVEELVYGDLEAAFDGVAEDYDRHIFGNPMNVWLRDVSVSIMSELFRPGEVVLEIGCGTGTETLSLAGLGVKVIATDISSRMLQVLERKAKAAGLSQNILTVHARPYQLRQKLTRLGYNKLDGAYSTYGAVNTEPRLPELIENLHSMLRPGGIVLLGVWNKYCFYEIFGYALRGKPSMTVARLRNPVPVGKSRFCVTTSSFSVGSLDKMLRPYFALKKVFGVVILLPPSNLTKYLPPEPLLSLVKRLDWNLGRTYPFNRLGDHFLAVYCNRAV